MHRAGASSQLVVVELVGELERSACMVEPRLGARPREPTVDDRLKRWVRSRLAQGFLEQWDGTPFGLEIGKENKSLGAQGASSCLREEIAKDTERARPLARAALSARRNERSTMPVGVGVWWRKPKRMLGKLGSGRQWMSLRSKTPKAG